MIFLDANAFYSYYGRSKLGMTSGETSHLPVLVLAIAEIGAQTGNSKIFFAAVQRGKAVVLTGDKPPVFIKGGFHGKLVMLKSEVGFRCSVVGIFRADMFECCQQLHPLSARLQTSRRQGQKWRL